jgi:hypothetical protein
MGFEGVPEKDEEVYFSIGYFGPYLLIAAQWPALELGDGNFQVALQQGARRTCREDPVLSQQIPVKPCPFQQIFLLVVVRHEGDPFHVLCCEYFRFHSGKPPAVAFLLRPFENPCRVQSAEWKGNLLL